MVNLLKLLSGSFLCLLLVSASNTSQAQKFSVGPQLGANIARIDGEGFKNGYNLSYHAGGYVSASLSKKWIAQVEVLWSQLNSKTVQGIDALYNNLISQDFQNPKLEYLSIPVSVYFKPGKLISFQGGLQYSILMNHNNTFLENGKDAFSKGDASALLGVQLHVLNLKIYGRYLIGLSDITSVDLQNEWKTSLIQAGVSFGIF